VWSLVSYLEGRAFTEIVLKQGTEEDTLTLEKGINRRPEKIALCGVSWLLLHLKML
jgi:hypothetical protein